MAIESIDRIVRMPISEMSEVCEIMGKCGYVFAVKVRPAMRIYDDIVLYTMTDIATGWRGSWEPTKEFDVLVPDTLFDPITEAEITTALAAKGVEF